MVVRVDILDWFLILKEMVFVVFIIENDVCCGLAIYGLYYVEVGSFYASFLKSFYHKRVLFLSRAFYASVEIIILFLSFNWLIW